MESRGGDGHRAKILSCSGAAGAGAKASARWVSARPATNLTMDATVTIVNYNTVDKLRDCLRSIAETTHGMAIETIVVDNGSKDGSVDMVRREFPDVRLVATGENLGFGRAHNRAMAIGTGRHFIVLNPDTVVEANTFRRLIAFMDDTPDAGACGPTIKDASGEFAHSGHRDFTLMHVAANAFNVRALLPSDAFLRKHFGRWLGKVHSAYHPHDALRQVDWIDGACLVVRRETYERVGGFDEKIFLNAEDWDWCYRIREAGWKIYHVPDVALQHIMHQSKEQVYVPSFVAHYRSMLYLFRKHYGRASYLAVKGILLVAFVCRLFLATLERFVPIRRRPAREAEAYRAVIVEALRYQPPVA
jgi:GT2 family glycosyltransferase